MVTVWRIFVGEIIGLRTLGIGGSLDTRYLRWGQVTQSGGTVVQE